MPGTVPNLYIHNLFIHSPEVLFIPTICQAFTLCARIQYGKDSHGSWPYETSSLPHNRNSIKFVCLLHPFYSWWKGSENNSASCHILTAYPTPGMFPNTVPVNLHNRRQRHRELKQPVHSHIGSKQWSEGWNQGCLVPVSMSLSTTLDWPVGFLLWLCPLKDDAYYVKTLLMTAGIPGSINSFAYRQITCFQLCSYVGR